MPMLATGNNSPLNPRWPAQSREAGFSLVELLAVMAIISLMVGAVIINLPRGADPFDQQINRMHARSQQFLDNGAQRGEIRAIGVDDDALVLFHHDGFEWQMAERMPWPEDGRVSLIANDRRKDLPETASPDFLFEPFGAVSPMEIRIWDDASQATLLSDVQSGELDLRVER